MEIEITGKEREKILKRAEKQIEKWGLILPQDFILVLDFGLKDFKNTGHIEYWIVNREKENYCGKFIFMFKGQRCPSHYHKKKDETFFILKGKVEMKYGRKKKIMKMGDTLVMPIKTEHTFLALQNSLILEVSNASVIKDNFFKDKRIKIGG
ncbi:cupin domain-containing protein [bacterium]|nr:cupin domain-containing protein [bacterium]